MLAFALTGCANQRDVTASGVSSGTTSDSGDVKTERVDFKQQKYFWVEYDIPSDWEEVKADGSAGKTYKSPGGVVMTVDLLAVQESSDLDSTIKDLANHMSSTTNTKVEGLEKLDSSQETAYQGDTTTKNDTGTYKGIIKYVGQGVGVYMLLIGVPESSYQNSLATIEEVANSFRYSSDESSGMGKTEDGQSHVSNTNSSASNDQATNQAINSFSNESIKNEMISDGTYKVGADIPAGEYKLTSTDSLGGYWEVKESSAADAKIIENDNFHNSTYVTVTDGQYLKLSGCTGQKVN